MSCLKNNPLAIVAFKFTARLVYILPTNVAANIGFFTTYSFIKSVLEDWKDEKKLDGFLDYVKNGAAYFACDFAAPLAALIVFHIFHNYAILPGYVLLDLCQCYKKQEDYKILKNNKNSHSKNEELDSPKIVQREIIDMVSEQQNEQSENVVKVSGDLSNAEL